MDEAEQGLHDLPLERLLADESAEDEVGSLLLAAWAGPGGTRRGDSRSFDRGHRSRQRPTQLVSPERLPRRATPRGLPPHRRARHGLVPRPGPCLTVVTVRNGSGKSPLRGEGAGPHRPQRPLVGPHHSVTGGLAGTLTARTRRRPTKRPPTGAEFRAWHLEVQIPAEDLHQRKGADHSKGMNGRDDHAI